MKAKLNDAQARAYIAGDQSEPAQEIERKHILHLTACLQEAAGRPGMNLADLCKTAERYVQNHQRTENRQELALLIAARDAIKARASAKIAPKTFTRPRVIMRQNKTEQGGRP